MEKNKEVILTKKWWEHNRFETFGNQVADVLNRDSALKDELRKLFKAQNDKLSYYDFFQFIEKKMKIKLQNWEESALESRLDRLCMAFIEFNEFNEFSQDYGLDWGEPLLETDLEDILDAKLNLSYKDYKVTKKN